MRSILEKALVALLNEDKQAAEQLFHDYVVARSRQIHDSTSVNEDVNVDAIVNGSIEVSDMFAESSKSGVTEGKSFKRNNDDEDSVATKKKEDKNRRDQKKSKKDQLDESAGDVNGTSNMEPGWYFVDRSDSPVYGPFDSEEKANASELSNSRFANFGVEYFSDFQISRLNEGKSFKRSQDDDEDDAGDKKKQDKQRRQERTDKRQPVQEASESGYEVHGVMGMNSKRFHKRFKTDAAREKWLEKHDGDIEVHGFRDPEEKKVAEGQLTATQGDDGTLTIVHEPTGSAQAEPELMATPIEGPTLDVPVETDFAQDADFAMDADMGDLSDDDFARLGESLASELERVLVPNKDGSFAVGGGVKQEKHSPIPNEPADKRVDGGKPAVTKGTEFNGYDREQAPSTVSPKVRQNAFKSADDTLEPSGPEGDKKALLNQIGDDKAAKSPIGGK